MATTLDDSNVILDVVTEDAEWLDWSAAMLETAVEQGPLAINREALPWEASFLAAKCFARYRRKADARRLPRPDFFIGAHAAVAGMTLLTRDARRYRTYFPKLKIVSP